MADRILLGPLLGIEDDRTYTVSFLTNETSSVPEVVVAPREYSADRIAATPSGVFWRATVPVAEEAHGRHLGYRIEIRDSPLSDPRGRSEWEFFVPGAAEEPRIAYASCNGFSSGDAKTKLDEPYRMWMRMVEDHAAAPFSLLLMGGDQIYADELWHSRRRAPSIAKWSRLGRAERTRRPGGAGLERELDAFYEGLYLRHWNQPEMSLMMASIPSLMMWDDHDVFDGWGSYPDDIQTCPVYQAIFVAARRYFELFQLRATKRTLLNPAGGHFSFAIRHRSYGILGLDHRSGRTTRHVMSDRNWSDVKERLQLWSGGLDALLVLSAVPVLYRDFATSESMMDLTPWEEELTDDVRDQWRSLYHQGERMKLIRNLFEFEPSRERRRVKRVILSGDVHVGCLGVIRDHRPAGETRLIHQVVSSAIVHPAPTRVEWLGILAGSNDEPERLDGGVTTSELLAPYGAGKYLRTRNYARLQAGSDGKLWVGWECEDGTRPEYPIEASP